MQLERLMEQAQFGQVGEMSGVAQTPVGEGERCGNFGAGRVGHTVRRIRQGCTQHSTTVY